MKFVFAAVGILFLSVIAHAQQPETKLEPKPDMDKLLDKLTFTKDKASLPYRLLKPDDYDQNGKYSGSKKSDLDPSLPTEATDPALCGALHLGPQGGMATGNGGAAGGMNNGLVALGGAGVLAAAVAAGLARSRRRPVAA